MNEWCAKVVPFVEYPRKRKSIIWKDCTIFYVKTYATLPELKPHVVTREEKGPTEALVQILLSVVPGLITLVVESLSSYLKGRQQRRIDEAVVTMRRTNR